MRAFTISNSRVSDGIRASQNPYPCIEVGDTANPYDGKSRVALSYAHFPPDTYRITEASFAEKKYQDEALLVVKACGEDDDCALVLLKVIYSLPRVEPGVCPKCGKAMETCGDGEAQCWLCGHRTRLGVDTGYRAPNPQADELSAIHVETVRNGVSYDTWTRRSTSVQYVSTLMTLCPGAIIHIGDTYALWDGERFTTGSLESLRPRPRPSMELLMEDDGASRSLRELLSADLG